MGELTGGPEAYGLIAPLFVIDRDGWLSVFDTRDAAESHLESTDVDDDEYVGYDAVGNELRFGVLQEDRPGWLRRLRYQPPVVVSTTGRCAPGALRRVLEQALADAPPRPRREDLGELVNDVSRLAKERILRTSARHSHPGMRQSAAEVLQNEHEARRGSRLLELVEREASHGLASSCRIDCRRLLGEHPCPSAQDLHFRAEARDVGCRSRPPPRSVTCRSPARI